MATTAKQIYGLVNDTLKETLGAKAIEVKDTSGLVSMGDTVLSNYADVEKFYGTLVDRIGRTIVAMRVYETRKKRRIEKGALDFGAILQKINVKMPLATSNNAWNVHWNNHTYTDSGNPYNGENVSETPVVQKFFKALTTWQTKTTTPMYQIKVAFTSAEAMGAFMSALAIAIQNAMTKELEELSNYALASLTAAIKVEADKTGSDLTTQAKNCFRNVLYTYNRDVLGLTWSDKTGSTAGSWSGTPLLATKALTDKEFLKYACREMGITEEYLANMSVAYNVGKQEKFTTKDKLVVSVLSVFDSATKTYLESDTYHNELVGLGDGYEVVPYWQAPGQSYAFGDISKIDIKNKEIKKDNSGEAVEVSQSGIIAIMYDEDAVGATFHNLHSNTMINYEDDTVIRWDRADVGYYADTNENCVVFYIADMDSTSTSHKDF